MALLLPLALFGERDGDGLLAIGDLWTLLRSGVESARFVFPHHFCDLRRIASHTKKLYHEAQVRKENVQDSRSSDRACNNKEAVSYPRRDA